MISGAAPGMLPLVPRPIICAPGLWSCAAGHFGYFMRRHFVYARVVYSGRASDAGEFRLAVCAELAFAGDAYVDRVRRLHDLGFAVEIWDWTTKDIDALVATGAAFTAMTGYVTGRLADTEGAEELLRTAEQSISVAHRLGDPLLVLHGTGLDERGLPVVPAFEVTGKMWLQAEKTLGRIAALGEREGVTFALENLNLVDHPGVPFANPEDVVALVRAVGSPGLRVMLDLYHAQIGGGNLIELICGAADVIAEIQVADVPGRHEPETGEINYRNIARALAEIGYRGTIALEARPSDDPLVALERFSAAFTTPVATSATSRLHAYF